ncbi:hypothetical protein [Micromonospora profundi]|uniref:hypothetical protein n=1 Tax=Micromonospora profundi TaxID=1420889 RepID=UPI003657572C
MTLDVDGRGIPIPGAAPVVGYIGQSRQTVWQREQQHREDQPFSDIIVGGSWTIEEGWWTQQQLDEREQHYIQHGVSLLPGQKPQRPKYNIAGNRDNKDRIKPWDAVAHRQAREPGWLPADQRGPGVPVLPEGRGWVPLRTLAARSDVRWAVVALAVVGWVASRPVATWYDGAVYVACVACTVTGLRMPGKRRRRRRSRR